MARKPQRVEPCHHVWLYYQRKVDARRKSKLPCSTLENMMWDYSMHAAFPMIVVQGAEYPWQRTKRLAAKERRLSSSPRLTDGKRLKYPLTGTEQFK